MKVVILAGGLGTRLAEETGTIPKPMVEIGGKPILWHIMKRYSAYGFNEFIICLGYKGYVIKEYFANYFIHRSDMTIDLATNSIEHHTNNCEPWKVTLVDTGLKTMTGARLKQIQKYVGNETFMLTYGDGVSEVDFSKLLDFHKQHSHLATVTAVQPEGKFGALETDDNNKIVSFREKPKGDNMWINGGFFVLEPKVFDYIADGNDVVWEQEPLKNLSKDGQLMTYKHQGFWKCMDTLNDNRTLNKLWSSGSAKWHKCE